MNEYDRIKQLCADKGWVDVETALYVAGIVGAKRVIEVLEAQPSRGYDEELDRAEVR